MGGHDRGNTRNCGSGEGHSGVLAAESLLLYRYISCCPRNYRSKKSVHHFGLDKSDFRRHCCCEQCHEPSSYAADAEVHRYDERFYYDSVDCRDRAGGSYYSESVRNDQAAQQYYRSCASLRGGCQFQDFFTYAAAQ